MALPRKKLAKRSSRRSVPARPGPSTLSAGASLEERLTAEILEIDRGTKTRVVRDVVEIGQRIKALQRHLGFGQWLAWLSQHLPFSPRTAQRYLAIAQWAADNPDDHQHFAPLGLGKLQLIAALTPKQRARFRRQQRFQIPGTRTRKTLALMTHAQLDAVIRGVDGFAATPVALPPSKVLQRFRHRVAGLDALADQLREHADALPEAEVEKTVEALEGVLAEVRSLLAD